MTLQAVLSTRHYLQGGEPYGDRGQYYRFPWAKDSVVTSLNFYVDEGGTKRTRCEIYDRPPYEQGAKLLGEEAFTTRTMLTCDIPLEGVDDKLHLKLIAEDEGLSHAKLIVRGVEGLE